MPRLNNAQELFRYLNSVTKYTIQTGTIGDTTTSGPLAAGASTVPVTAITNFTSGDPAFLIGDGGVELISAIGTPATSMPITNQKIAIAQSTGARFVEAVAIALGHVSDAGATFGGTQQLTPVPAATSRSALTFLKQSAELTFSFALLGYNNLNLLAAFGAPESGETGTGTAADPHQALIGQSNIGTQSTQCIRLMGDRIDGKTVQVDLLDVTIEVNVSAQIGTATPAGITIAGKMGAVIQRIYT
ncbi:MAG TPA: hypothetical protein VFN76_10000 [Candidatus Limnocylindria bacterium]|nr:hypothetical protein [Candidatus Limnocylindria bacterium]